VPNPVIDIRVFGDEALAKALASFEPKVQKKVVRSALRKSLKRLKAHVVRNLSGHPVAPDSGRYLAAMIAAKPKALPRSRSSIGVGIAMPTREELGIPPDYKKGFYPFSLEYGYTRTERAPVVVPAKAPIRRAVNSHQAEELRVMGDDVGRGVEREARKHFKLKGSMIRGAVAI
jgi:hypothetical protein